MIANLHKISSWAGCNVLSHFNTGTGQSPSLAIVQRLQHRAAGLGSLTDKDIVSIDGKTMRGTIKAEDTKGVFILSAHYVLHTAW